jgi:hypothetical protein
MEIVTMKALIVVLGLTASFTAAAQQSASVKEVASAYCFGALTTQARLLAEKADEKCNGRSECHASFKKFGPLNVLDQKKAQLIRYLNDHGDPKRQELRSAVAEGATDADRCVWKDENIEDENISRSSTTKVLKINLQECSLVDACSALSRTSP